MRNFYVRPGNPIERGCYVKKNKKVITPEGMRELRRAIIRKGGIHWLRIFDNILNRGGMVMRHPYTKYKI